MAKVIREEIGRFYHHYPRVAAIITAQADGKSDAMAAAWHSPISVAPPIYGVSIHPKRFSLELILKGKEFGVNFIPFDRAELVASVGGSKGEEIDKFQRFGIATEPPSKTAVPILKDAYAAYECRLLDHKTYGDHEWIVGEILVVHLLEESFTPQQVLDLDRVSPLLYLGAELYLGLAKETMRQFDCQIYGKRGE